LRITKCPSDSGTIKSSIISLFVLAATLPLFAGDGGVLPSNLGDGELGLCIIYFFPNEWVVFVDESLKKDWKQGDEWNPQYHDKPIKVLASQNIEWAHPYDLAHPYDIGHTDDLFPFDEQTVFTCNGDQNTTGWPRETRVFSTNGLLSSNVDTLARAKYGLGTNQWFLGKVGPNIFYTETGKRNVVYFRTTQEKFAANYFKLPGVDDIIWGVKKALGADNDVGFCIDRGLHWYEGWKYYGWAPNALPSFVEFSLKDAKHRKIPKHFRGN
jgi:hypothetical protein